MFYCWCFISFFSTPLREISELRRPIDVKLRYVIASMFSIIIQVPKFRGAPPHKNLGPKTCKIGGNFGQLQSSTANKSGKDRGIQNRKTNVPTAIPPAFREKVHKQVYGVLPLKFAHALENDQGLPAHTPAKTGVRQQCLTMNIQKLAQNSAYARL